MKKRNIGLVMLFSLITLGIYELFWLVSTKDEMNRKGQNVPSMWLVFAPLLALVAVALLQVVTRLVINGNGATSSFISVVNILSAILGVVAVVGIIPAAVYWIVKYCKAVEVVTNGQLSFGLNIGLWLAFNFISIYFVWPGIVQDYFNKVEAASPTPHEHPPAPHHTGSHHPPTHHITVS